MSSRERTIAVIGLVGIFSVSIGSGAAFGWGFGVLCFGMFALLISLSQA